MRVRIEEAIRKELTVVCLAHPGHERFFVDFVQGELLRIGDFEACGEVGGWDVGREEGGGSNELYSGGWVGLVEEDEAV